MIIEGWVATCKVPRPDIFRVMGYCGAALLFRTRKDAREFVRAWRVATKGNSPVKVIRASLAAK